MILLSALLASLTGLMVGDAHVAPAQVELSASSDLVDTGSTSTTVALVTAVADDLSWDRQAKAGLPSTAQRLSARDARFHIDMKQSWLI